METHRSIKSENKRAEVGDELIRGSESEDWSPGEGDTVKIKVIREIFFNVDYFV